MGDNQKKISVAYIQIPRDNRGRLTIGVSSTHLAHLSRTYKANLLTSPQDCTQAVIAATLAISVVVVLCLGAQKQMFWIDARPIVAIGTIVQDAKTGRNWTKVEDVREPMRVNAKLPFPSNRSHIKQAVAVGFLSRPQPTRISFHDEAQEPLTERQVRTIREDLPTFITTTVWAFLNTEELSTADFADEGSFESCHNNLQYRSVVVRIGGRSKRSPFRILAQEAI